MGTELLSNVAPCLEAVGYDENPMCILHSDDEPKVGLSPKPLPRFLPTGGKGTAKQDLLEGGFSDYLLCHLCAGNQIY